MFSKGLFPRGIKGCHCMGMGWDTSVDATNKGQTLQKEQSDLLSTYSKWNNFQRALFWQFFRIFKCALLIFITLNPYMQRNSSNLSHEQSPNKETNAWQKFRVLTRFKRRTCGWKAKTITTPLKGILIIQLFCMITFSQTTNVRLFQTERLCRQFQI